MSINGVAYEVDHDLAGETVILWWGIFDRELYVEHTGKRFGPYLPVGGPIPLNRYRKLKKTRTQSRADRIEQLAQQLKLPREMFGDDALPSSRSEPADITSTAFVDPAPSAQTYGPHHHSLIWFALE